MAAPLRLRPNAPDGEAACLESTRLVSLLDMLDRYAFGFYEVVTRLAQLRYNATLSQAVSAYTSALTARFRRGSPGLFEKTGTRSSRRGRGVRQRCGAAGPASGL